MKKGFTLSEVLITLAIIGVVAAITIPTLVEKYKEQIIVRKLEKMYSVLSNAYGIYRIDNPHIEPLTWSEQAAKDAYAIFKPYLRISKDCGTQDTSCYHTDRAKSVSGHTTYDAYGPDSRYYKVILADGETLMFRGGGDGRRHVIILYDVNGKQAPNTWGKDIFQFQVYPNENMLKIKGLAEGEFETGCVGNGAQGDGCAGWIILNKNMDYLHCEGLIFGEHTSCKDLNK